MSEFYNCHIHDCQPKLYGDAVMVRSMICPGCEKAVEENKRLREALKARISECCYGQYCPKCQRDLKALGGFSKDHDLGGK